MSKIVTATAACRLADEGRLDLDAPVDEYVEYLQAAPGTTTPNVGQLLNHTAGFGNPMLARYSNVGYLAAGQVIAAAAGMPFGAYVRQSVLKPVGMEHTGFRYQDGADRATGYVKAPRLVDPLLRGLLPGGIAGPRHGAGPVAEPLLRGRARLRRPGGRCPGCRQVPPPAPSRRRDRRHPGPLPRAARRMRTIDQPGKPFDHGTGWFRRPTRTPGQWVEHSGAGAGFWNVMRLYPGSGLGVVVLGNSTRMYDYEPLFALLASAPWA